MTFLDHEAAAEAKAIEKLYIDLLNVNPVLLSWAESMVDEGLSAEQIRNNLRKTIQLISVS